tara:strand:- start:2848 stop:3120 length:273 start_codon:yes stop_codon:yes gene_type:complete
MPRRRLKEGDIVILNDMPSEWSRPGEDYRGMLYERFDMYAKNGKPADWPCWCWRIQWFSDIPPTYTDHRGLAEINIINMTSINKGTHIPL